MSGTVEYRAADSGRLSLRHAVVWSGFADPDPVRRWTTGDEAAIEFARPLPDEATVTVRARAFGPNVGAPVRVCAGGDCATATFPDTDSDATVPFTATGRGSS